MLEFFRRNMKLYIGILMVPLVIGFVLFGVQGYTRFIEGKDVVAKVGSTEITRQEWDAAHRQEVERRMASNPNMDRALLESDPARNVTLERMVNERLLTLAAQKQFVVTADQRLVRELSQDPTIAGLRGADGKLDTKRYAELLRAQGMTPEMFENSMRQDLARRQVLQGVSASGFVTTAVAQADLNAYFERRDIQVARFEPVQYKAKVQISDADIEKFYQANTAMFQSPEQADVEYVVLDLDAVAKRITVNEADLRAYYDQNAALQAKDEQRRASHILLTLPAGASAADKAKIKEKAESLLAEVRKNPARFAEIAKAQSQDPGSASRGGDLDFFARGAMVKPFEDAVFALKKGEISDVVESDFGFHIIQLTDIRKPVQQPFEAVRAKLEQEYKRQQAQKQFAEAAETFSNLVYEQSDSLQPVAQKLGLTVKSAKGVLRSGLSDPGNPDAAVWATPKLLQAVFAEDSVRSKHNTEAVEAGQNRMVAAHVLAYRPAAVRPLSEVTAQVKDRLTQQRAVELAVADGKAKLDAWKGGATASLPASVVVSRNQLQGLSPTLVGAALSAKVDGNAPAWAGVDLGQGGYAVIRVNKVLSRETPVAAQAEQERAQLGQLEAQAQADAYLSALKARYKVQIMHSAPQKAGS